MLQRGTCPQACFSLTVHPETAQPEAAELTKPAERPGPHAEPFLPASTPPPGSPSERWVPSPGPRQARPAPAPEPQSPEDQPLLPRHGRRLSMGWWLGPRSMETSWRTGREGPGSSKPAALTLGSLPCPLLRLQTTCIRNTWAAHHPQGNPDCSLQTGLQAAPDLESHPCPHAPGGAQEPAFPHFNRIPDVLGHRGTCQQLSFTSQITFSLPFIPPP